MDIEVEQRHLLSEIKGITEIMYWDIFYSRLMLSLNERVDAARPPIQNCEANPTLCGAL